MRREHNAAASGGGGGEDLFMYLPLNGDFIDQVSGEDISPGFGSSTVTSWYADPADSSRQCLRNVNDGSYKSFPYLFRKNIDGTYRYLLPATTAAYPSTGSYYSLLGKTAEFWWYPQSSSGNKYILEDIDSLISTSTSGLYGYDLYRNGATLYIYAKGRLGNANKNQQYTWGAFTNYKWYRITLAYKDNGDSTCTSTYKLYGSDGTLLLNSDTLGMPPVPHGDANSLCTSDRIQTFFHSHYSYYGAGVNTLDYIKEFKIYNDLL
jgi:hypothetical protein